jgi:hypothetical protein
MKERLKFILFSLFTKFQVALSSQPDVNRNLSHYHTTARLILRSRVAPHLSTRKESQREVSFS